MLVSNCKRNSTRCDSKTVTNLRRKGLPSPAADLAGAVRWYVAHVDSGRVVDVDSRKRIELARARLLELDAAERRGEVLPRELFEEQLVEIGLMFVNNLDGAESRLRRAAPSAQAEIADEIRTIRQDLARRIAAHIEGLEAGSRAVARIESTQHGTDARGTAADANAERVQRRREDHP